MADLMGELPATEKETQIVNLNKELKDMKTLIDAVSARVQILTKKVNENQYLTAEGMSYLDSKHLLLLSYCECIVYYILRKAQGLPVHGHPLVEKLVEFRLFLEKIGRIDKKLQFQIHWLIQATINASKDGANNAQNKEEDTIKYGPNPENLVCKIDPVSQGTEGVYRPPKFAPVSMDGDSDVDRVSKKEKLAMKEEKQLLRHAKHATKTAYMKEIMDDLEGRPEEIRETYGIESREFSRYKAKREERDQQEEELFTRAPVTKKEKKLEKHMKKSRNGLRGLADDFFGETRIFAVGEEEDRSSSYAKHSGGRKPFKKHKRH